MKSSVCVLVLVKLTVNCISGLDEFAAMLAPAFGLGSHVADSAKNRRQNY
jgi:hypothetical protein